MFIKRRATLIILGIKLLIVEKCVAESAEQSRRVTVLFREEKCWFLRGCGFWVGKSEQKMVKGH